MVLEAGLVITTSVMSIVGIGSLIGMVTSIRNWGKAEQSRLDEIKEIKDDITEIKEVLNNGGLVGGIKEIQMNCIGKMTQVETVLAAHIAQPGHGDLPIKVAKLDARVEILEKNVK